MEPAVSVDDPDTPERTAAGRSTPSSTATCCSPSSTRARVTRIPVPLRQSPGSLTARRGPGKASASASNCGGDAADPPDFARAHGATVAGNPLGVNRSSRARSYAEDKSAPTVKLGGRCSRRVAPPDRRGHLRHVGQQRHPPRAARDRRAHPLGTSFPCDTGPARAVLDVTGGRIGARGMTDGAHTVRIVAGRRRQPRRRPTQGQGRHDPADRCARARERQVDRHLGQRRDFRRGSAGIEVRNQSTEPYRTSAPRSRTADSPQGSTADAPHASTCA